VAPRRPRVRAALTVAFALAVLAGCGKPPDLREPPPRRTPSPAPPTPSLAPTTAPAVVAPTTVRPSPTGFPEGTAVACGGRPGGSEVLAVLRRAGIVTAGSGAQVTTGPLCAGSWQWSVVRVPNSDPLQVVSRGPAGALRLVTAGTDVCSIEVRAAAPAGIRAAACDARPPGL
jgi:hypothetical protein